MRFTSSIVRAKVAGKMLIFAMAVPVASEKAQSSSRAVQVDVEASEMLASADNFLSCASCAARPASVPSNRMSVTGEASLEK